MKVTCVAEYKGLQCALDAGHDGAHEHFYNSGKGSFKWLFKEPPPPTTVLPDGVRACADVYEPFGVLCELADGHAEPFHRYRLIKWLTTEEKRPEMNGNGNADDMKQCKGKRCKRYRVVVFAPNRRYCSVCGSKLKNVWGYVLDPNNLPVNDPGPDEPPKQGQRGFGQASTGKVITLGPPPITTLEMLTFSQFKGDWQEYNKYKEAFEDGRVLDNEPYMYERDKKNKAAASSDTFTVCGDIKGCPVMNKREDEWLIKIPNNMFRDWVWLCLKFSTEWIAYLKGSQDTATGVWTIESMYFPKQKANGAHVDAEDGEIQKGTIGSVHSHVSMGAFFSDEDERHFNHPVEIVVNRRGELAMCVRVPLECGRFTRLKTDCLLIGSETAIALANDLQSKLTEEKGYSTHSHHSYSH